MKNDSPSLPCREIRAMGNESSLESAMPIPHNVRTIARQTYRHFLTTGKTTNYCNGYGAAVSDDCESVFVAKSQSEYWQVPVTKGWI